MNPRRVPVLIVGAGPAGLVAALLLHRLGVRFLLLERRMDNPALPKAHLINQRSVEILAECGILAELQDVAAPHSAITTVAWYTSFTGPTPLHGRELGRVDAWGGGAKLAEHQAASPYHTTDLPQLRLEPLLFARLRAVAGSDVLVGHEVVGIEQEPGGVRAAIRSADGDVTVEADFLIGADGGRTVGEHIGVSLVGQRDLVNMVSAHISLDLRDLNPDPTASMYWFVNPDKGASINSGNLVKIGGRGWGRDADEWVFNLGKAVHDPVDITAGYFVDHVRRAIGDPELDVVVHRVSEWTIESVIAADFARGRVFLIGDAAHRHSPTGGLGMNSAIADAHNLVWKLVLVLHGKANATLLDTYERERKPVVTRNAEQSITNFAQLGGIDVALGITSEMPVDQRWAAIAELFAETPEGTAKRVALDDAIHATRHGFMSENLQIGYHYTEGALISDGTSPRSGQDDIVDYLPTTRPGHRLPHVWVAEGVSTIHLLAPGRFLLIVGSEGDHWRRAAEKFELIDVVGIGPAQEYPDSTGRWRKLREISDRGAILVRPDTHVAWRSINYSGSAVEQLSKVMNTLLFTPSA